jgi:ABC-type transporter Mla subunit MlaD
MYGDTAAIRRRASDLDRGSEDVRERASSVVSRAGNLEWHSTAAAAFRSKVGDHAQTLSGSGHKLEAAAEKLRAHASEVDRIKAEIERAMQSVQAVWDSAASVVGNAVEVAKTVASSAVNEFMKVVDTVHDAVADAVTGDGGKVAVHVFEMFGQEVSRATVDRAREVITARPTLPTAGDREWLGVRDTFTSRGWVA